MPDGVQVGVDMGSGPDRSSMLLLDLIPDEASWEVGAILGGITPPLGAPVSDEDKRIADRLLAGTASAADYAHAKRAGWQMWRYQEA